MMPFDDTYDFVVVVVVPVLSVDKARWYVEVYGSGGCIAMSKVKHSDP